MQFMSRNVARDINSGDPPDLHLRDSSVGSVEGDYLCRSGSQANTLSHARRRVTCVYSRKGSQICATNCTVIYQVSGSTLAAGSAALANAVCRQLYVLLLVEALLKSKPQGG